LGLGVPSLTMLHLLTHAFFKSCLFIQIGIFIHLSYSLQDGRFYVRATQLSRGSRSIISVCLFRLCGLLFTSGFVRKDLVIQSFGLSVTSLFFWLITCASIVFTYIYSLRLFFMLNSASNLVQSSSYGSLLSLLYSVPLLTLGVAGGWLIMFNTESYPILLRFWGKVVPFSLLLLSAGLLFFWSSYILESNVSKIGGADLIVSELQLLGTSMFTFFEKSVESTRVKRYKLGVSPLIYFSYFFSGFGGIWMFGLLVFLILF
jgi:NADH:ubiquinone oxidoreductase subunit 5 (subunit L)/multisubunit Na+/H+ antiporter MnhA subunit